MNLTNFLLAIIIFILLRQFYPSEAEVLKYVVLAIISIWFIYWLVVEFPEKRRRQKAANRQEEQDNIEFFEYQRRHDAIRNRYDPKNGWDEASTLPEEYIAEIRSLNLEYASVLRRRNGWTSEDFEE